MEIDYKVAAHNTVLLLDETLIRLNALVKLDRARQEAFDLICGAVATILESKDVANSVIRSEFRDNERRDILTAVSQLNTRYTDYGPLFEDAYRAYNEYKQKEFDKHEIALLEAIKVHEKRKEAKS